MKSKYALAIKFFTESKNEEQLDLSYKEIEKFMTTYEEFKFFFNFSIQEIPLDSLSDDEKSIVDDPLADRLTDEFKFKICEEIFGAGDFNFELFQYALEKVFEEERKKEEEEEEKLLEESKPKVSWYESISKSNFFKYFSGGVILLSIGSLGVHYYLYSSSAYNSLFK